MSTLTKILIVLLSVLSFFLCGIVIHYVAAEVNYKPKYDDLRGEYRALEKKYDDALALVNEKELAMNRLEDELKAAINELVNEKGALKTELNKVQARNITLQDRVNSLAGTAMGYDKTFAEMVKSLQLTESELEQARANEINLEKQRKQLTSHLQEKIVQLDSVERERKRLLEANKQLEGQFGGKGVVIPRPVTVRKYRGAKPLFTPQELGVPLRGLVTAVGGSIATISIGSADGVSEGMRFHVVRGGGFICDIIITDVDSETSAGTIKLKQQNPIIDDKVSTDFEF